MIEKTKPDGRQAVYHEDGQDLYAVVQQALPDAGFWISDDVYLERDEVAELERYLAYWLRTGKLF